MKRILIILIAFFAFSQPLTAGLMRQSTAQEVVVWFFDVTTGAPETGLTVTSIACRIIEGDMTTATFSPTASGGSHDMVEIGHGAYRLELTATDTSTVGFLDVGCSISGSTSPPNLYTVLADSSFLTVVNGTVASIDDIWAYDAGDITVVGSVGKQITDNVDATISSRLTPETLMDTPFEGAHTFKHFLQYGASALFGKYNSAAGTFNFRDLGDTKNRIVYDTTATARSTVTLSPD